MASIKKKQNMLEGHPGSTLFLFALPLILGNLFQQFYNMVDSIIVGQFVSENALAAVGASYSLTTVFVMFATGGGIGASVITSQYLGAGNFEKMKTSIYTALSTFLGVGIVLGGIGFAMNRIILTALNTPSNILDMACEYLGIYFLGLPFLFMYNILSSMFNSLGDSRTPLMLLIFSSILNVILDLWFVIQFEMGVSGVAIATVMAQGTSAVISFLLLMKKLRGYEANGKVSHFDTVILRSMVRIAIPSILQQSIVSIGMLLVQSVVNGFGSSVVAGYSAGTRIESICIVPMISTGNAVSTFTAQNMGAGKPERVRAGYRAANGIVFGFAALILLALTLLDGQIIGAFVDSGSTSVAFETGVSYLNFIRFFFVFIGLKAITDGVLRGAGDVFTFTLANLVNLGVRVAVAFTLAPVIGVQAVWYAVPIGWGVNYLISGMRYLSGKWSQKKLVENSAQQTDHKCIIIGAGNFDMDHISAEVGDFVIAADGGYAYCRSIQLEPDLILGDFDSLAAEAKKEIFAASAEAREEIFAAGAEAGGNGCSITGAAYGEIRVLPTEKDDTDTLSAIREGLARGYRSFEIYGSQGGRLSHTIANIQSLLFLKENGASGSLIEKNSRVFLIKEETVSFPEDWNGYLSLFSLGERAEGVSIRNMKYELSDAVLTNSFPVGVSNEFVGKTGSVSVMKGTLLAIYESNLKNPPA